jgi:hypothetical protein
LLCLKCYLLIIKYSFQIQLNDVRFLIFCVGNGVCIFNKCLTESNPFRILGRLPLFDYFKNLKFKIPAFH